MEDGETKGSVAKRLVFLFPGFEPLTPEAQVARFKRAAERSASAFDATITFETPGAEVDAASRADRRAARIDARFRTASGGAPVETRLLLGCWDDLIEDYSSRFVARRLVTGFGALFAFVLNGTFLRYLRTSWRYALFFLFPIVLTLAIAGIGVLIALTLGGIYPGPTNEIVGAVIAIATAAILFHLANRRWHILIALDDWSLARDLCKRANPRIEGRIEAFADMMRSEARIGGFDEIVVVAHSLGASFAIPALARAFDDGLAPSAPLHVLTVGSSLLKTALHPKAGWQSDAVRKLTIDYGIPWTDCQALTDPINFYNSNPARSLGIHADPEPLVIKIRLRHMVSAETYRRIKRDFFRLHRQFVLAIERRAPYSLHVLLLGPISMATFRGTRTIERPPLVAERVSKPETRLESPSVKVNAE